MKKKLIPLSLFFISLGSMAQDFNVYSNNIGGEEMLELFYAALQDGRRYPTDAEFEAAGYDLMDIAFVRSHVRPRSAMVDHSKDVNPIVGEGRRLWMNIPIGVGKHTGGYPNSRFTDDCFSGWNYTHIFGSWNHDLFHVPAATVDAGHRNGTDVYSGIKFFESWTAGSQASGWVNVISAQDPKGYDGYKYVEPLINCLMYFGQDGINYNWEDAGYSQPTVIKFHQACYKLAKERGFDNFHIGLYTSISALTSQGSTEALLGKDGVKTADAFLNYSGGSFASYGTIAKSVETAEKYFGSAKDVYQGALLSGLGADKNWQALNKTETCKRMQVVLWGEHDQSRIFSWCKGEDAQDFAEMYQKRQEYFFSGGNRNPAVRPTPGQQCKWRDIVNLLPFEGVAEYIPERVVLQQSLPFTTNFCLGSGERYYYKGKRTHGSWYNMGQQDIVPTYRWLVYEAGTTNPMTLGLPEYTFGDAYIGGTSVRLTSEKPQDVVLYRCALTVDAANPMVSVALKRPANVNADGTLSVIVKKQGSNEWIETTLPAIVGHTWTTVEAPLQGIAEGDVIEYVGFRTNGNTKGLLVGQLSLTDDCAAVVPASVSRLKVQDCQVTLDNYGAKLSWDVVPQTSVAADRAASDLIYNDEVGIDHFEVFLKNGMGRVREVGRTSTWSAYLGNIVTSADNVGDFYVGVRSASVDGKTYSPVVWTALPMIGVGFPNKWLNNLDGWPAIRLDLDGESIDGALKGAYIESFLVTGADEDYSYTNAVGNPYMADLAAGVDADHADKTNYMLADEPIRVTQGQTLRCTLRLPEALQQSCARGYADWDGNRQFDVTSFDLSNAGQGGVGGVTLTDEQVWTSGLSNNKKMNTELGATANFQIKVPADAKPGESRLRLVFNSNFYAHPGPSGLHVGGFAIDFPLEISGDNAPRAVTPDYRDQGEADEPENLSTGEAVGIVLPTTGESSDSNPKTTSRTTLENGAIRIDHANGRWHYDAEGRRIK